MLFENLITQLETLQMLMRTFTKLQIMIVYTTNFDSISVYQVFTSIQNKEYSILIDEFSQFTSPDIFHQTLTECKQRYNVSTYDIMKCESFSDRNVTPLN